MPTSLYLDSQKVYRSPVLEQFSWLEHGFGTRESQGWPNGRQVTTVRQIHSNRAVLADGRTGMIGEADALLASEPGTLVAIRTADCLPILVVDPKTHAVAAIHAGWRGTVAAIAPKTVEAMTAAFESRLSDLVVVIGPGIGACCFEVGPEVAEQFQPFFPERSDLRERTRINLEESNYRQLRRLGIDSKQIFRAGLCTCCHTTLFHSYRRDREASGRMLTAIGVRV